MKSLRVAIGMAFLGTFALGACGGLAPASNSATPLAPSAFVPTATEWIYKDGILFHRPHYAAPYVPRAGAKPAFVFVPYLGGPVILDPKFYLIFWGYNIRGGDPDKVQRLLEKYADVMGGSGHNNIEIQYYQGSSGSREYITNPRKQFGGSWNDDSAVPKNPSDTQIAAEAVKAVHHFGYDANGVYFVATPHNHSEVGFPTHWCAYHSYTFDRKKPVPYAYFPYIPDGGTGCGQNIITPPSDESGIDEGVTIMGGHEFGETITDPQPFSAWNGPSGEIADECAWHNIANDSFGRKSFTMQPMASDATEACVQTYTPAP
jgi:hypothetical protein